MPWAGTGGASRNGSSEKQHSQAEGKNNGDEIAVVQYPRVILSAAKNLANVSCKVPARDASLRLSMTKWNLGQHLYYYQKQPTLLHRIGVSTNFECWQLLISTLRRCVRKKSYRKCQMALWSGFLSVNHGVMKVSCENRVALSREYPAIYFPAGCCCLSLDCLSRENG